MSAIKKFKLRKVYHRKKNFTLQNELLNGYIIIPVSKTINNHLVSKFPHVNFSYIPSYLQVTKISTGGMIIQIVPININNFIKKDNIDLKDCLGIFYTNKWYPGYFLKNIKSCEKNLLSILILLKRLKSQ